MTKAELTELITRLEHDLEELGYDLLDYQKLLTKYQTKVNYLQQRIAQITTKMCSTREDLIQAHNQLQAMEGQVKESGRE